MAEQRPRPDPDPIGHALQMYTYYGQISWQTLAVFAAGGTVVALMPLTLSYRLSVWMFAVNAGFALGFLAFGAIFFNRYQTLAHRWIHVGDDTTIEDLIDSTELGRRYRQPGHPQPRPPSPTPRLGIALVAFVMGYFVFICVLYLT